MKKLTRNDLWSLEQYAERRATFRAEVMAHKGPRRLALGPHATLIFEDRLTIQYQVQEMLRAERIFTGPGIEEELAAYNPLIPDGTNWKATLMIEYEDVEERRAALARMPGLEHTVFVRIGDTEPVRAIANEDLDRSSDEKTSAVHFLRFELDDKRINALGRGAALAFGIEHAELPCEVTVTGESRKSLLADLD